MFLKNQFRLYLCHQPYVLITTLQIDQVGRNVVEIVTLGWTSVGQHKLESKQLTLFETLLI